MSKKNLDEYLNEELLMEMAQFRSFADNLVIWIIGRGEGSIQYFHIAKGIGIEPQQSELKICIQFLTADYFHHGINKDVLNSNQRKKLVEFLGSPEKHIPQLTVWERIVITWNDTYPDNPLSNNLEMPDYTHLR